MSMSFSRLLGLIFLLAFLQSLSVFAEDLANENFRVWKKNVEEAGKLLEQEDSDITDLEEMRRRLAGQREEALAMTAKGSVRVRTLQAQLTALGPAPGEGEVESEEIAKQRRELQQEISQANAPLINAEQFAQQSDVLIKELDSAIRKETASTLFSRNPSPIIPTLWLPAATQLGASLQQVKKDYQQALNDPYGSALLRDRLPLAIFLFLLGIFVITFLRGIVLRRYTYIHKNWEQDKIFNWPAITISMAHLFLPGLGAAFFIGGFYLLQQDLHVLKRSLSFLPLIAVIFTVGHWLGNVLFAPGKKSLRLIKLGDDRAAAGYRILLFLGLALSLQVALELLEIDYEFTSASKSVLTLPIILLGSFCLWHLANILQHARQQLLSSTTDDDTESAVEGSFLLIFSQLLRLTSFLAVLFTILGFTNLARHTLAPTIVTVAIFILGILVFRVLMALFEPVFSGKEEKVESSRSLLPIGMIFIIMVLMAPFLALNWGVRWTTLVEIWWALNEGLTIGNTRISLDIILLLVIVFVLGLGITRWLQKIFRVAILPRTKLDIGGQNALVTGIGYTGITLSALVAISSAGLDLSSLAILAGALSVGIGFGLQTIASNFVSGIILLIERPIKEGDWIEVSGYSGYVRKISVRSTRIETFDRHDVIIPNSDLVAGVVKNMTLTGMIGRVIVPVGIAYGSDVEEARHIILGIADKHQMVQKYPAPIVLFIGLGESSVDFELRCFIRDVNYMLSVRSDLYFMIYKEFAEAGIEIPFPQREVTLKQS